MRTMPTPVSRLLGTITPLGRSVICLGLAGWGGAWFTGWEELAVAAATFLLAAIAAIGFTVGRNEFAVELTLEPQRVTVGKRASGQLLVTNTGGRRSLPASVELKVGSATPTFRVPTLADGEGHDELFSVPTNRRAVITVGPASTVRGDPIGLLRREQPWTETIDLFVHPRIAPLDRLGSGFLRDLEGQTTQDLSPSDVAFHTLREYVPGDDLRHIHWKTTARIGTMMVRQFVDTRRSLLAVLVGTDPSEYASEDEFELVVSIAASIGVRALRDEQNVHFIAGRREVPSITAVHLLDSTSAIDSTPGTGSLDDAVSEANRIAADASIVAIAVGSETPLAELRGSISRLKADSRVLLLRADIGGASEVRTFGNIVLFNVPDLAEFGRLMFQASNG